MISKYISSIIQAASLSFLISTQAFGANTCVTGNENNKNLIDQLENAKKSSVVSQMIIKKYNLGPQTEAQSGEICTTCSTQVMKPAKNLADVQNLTPSTNTALVFNTDCLKATSLITAAKTELHCPGNKSVSSSSCFTAEQVQYQNAVISDFYKCVRKVTDLPLKPEALFEIYGLESTFKPNHASAAGVGLGQLTSIFIEDVQQKHRGQAILKTIAAADMRNSPCDTAKQIAEKDLKQPLKLSQNRCSFVQVGEGLERNILYTLVGLANSWKKDIEPVMKSYNSKHSNDPLLIEAKQLALLNAYGHGGRAAARAAVNRLSNLAPKEFVQAMQKPLLGKNGNNLTSYTSKIKSKQKQVLNKITGEPLKSNFAKDGASACVNQSSYQ